MLGTRMAKVASWIWCGPRRFHGWSPLESHLCHKVPQSAACDDGTSTSLQVTKRGVCEGDKSKISWTQDLLSTMNCRLLLCFLFAFASFCTLFALQVVAWQQSYSWQLLILLPCWPGWNWLSSYLEVPVMRAEGGANPLVPFNVRYQLQIPLVWLGLMSLSQGNGSIGEFYSVALTNNYQQASLYWKLSMKSSA